MLWKLWRQVHGFPAFENNNLQNTIFLTVLLKKPKSPRKKSPLNFLSNTFVSLFKRTFKFLKQINLLFVPDFGSHEMPHISHPQKLIHTYQITLNKHFLNWKPEMMSEKFCTSSSIKPSIKNLHFQHRSWQKKTVITSWFRYFNFATNLIKL